MKKAQIAFEFLMTYGWAILLILFSISTLFYMGVIDINSMLPQQAMFPPLLEAEYFKAEDSKIILLLQNNFFESIEINPNGYKGTDDCNEIIDFSFTQGIILPEEYFQLNFTCNTNKKRIKAYLSFNYTNHFSGVSHIHTGFVKVNNK